MSDAVASYTLMKSKYIVHVSSGQLVDGLDAFYADFQNRNILISNGVWIVVNQIAGSPNVNDMIINFRRNAK